MTEALPLAAGPVFDPLPVCIAAAGLAVLWLHAAGAKATDRDVWTMHLAAYGVPALAVPWLAWLLPLAEAAIGLALVTPWRAPAALSGAALLGVYALAMAFNLMRGRRPDCGCGGGPLPLSWWLVARNVALAGVALVAAAADTGRALGWGEHAVAVAAVALASLLYAAAHQVLRQHDAGRAGAVPRRTA